MAVFNVFKDPRTGRTTIAMSDNPITYIDHAGTVDINGDEMFIDGVPIEEYQNRQTR